MFAGTETATHPAFRHMLYVLMSLGTDENLSEILNNSVINVIISLYKTLKTPVKSEEIATGKRTKVLFWEEEPDDCRDELRILWTPLTTARTAFQKYLRDYKL